MEKFEGVEMRNNREKKSAENGDKYGSESQKTPREETKRKRGRREKSEERRIKERGTRPWRCSMAFLALFISDWNAWTDALASLPDKDSNDNDTITDNSIAHELLF